MRLRGATYLALLALVSPAQAAFPGANGKVAIDSINPSNPGLGTINPDGTGMTILTTNGGGGEWSPDGTKIAFTRCSGSCHLWVMNADGSGQTQVTNGSDERNPSWSPDGSRLLFTRSFSEIRTAKADGTDENLVASGLAVGYTPQWSPDGTKIVFSSSHRHPVTRNGEIFTVRLDGTDLTRLTTATDLNCDSYPDTSDGPDWSPDGTKIAFMNAPETDNDGECDWGTDLNVMNADGTDNHLIVYHHSIPDYIEGPPSWSPDGSKITFDASAVAYLVDSDGGPAAVLTGDGPPSDWQPMPSSQPGGYPRPKGATPIHASLVQAFDPCTAPNRTHGPPLAFGSCAPPAPASRNVTAGGSGGPAPAKSSGYLRIGVSLGVPGPPDNTDAPVRVELTNVMRPSDLADYTGELRATASIRMTDRDGGAPSTIQDFPLGITVPCMGTADTTVGATCAVQTTFDSVLPGLAPEGVRSVQELGQVRVFDGGPDEDADTEGDNSLFAVQGLFVP